MMPPNRPSQLPQIKDNDIEPLGLMKQYLGNRIASNRISLNWSCTAKDRRMKDAVRAYQVKALLGTQISVADDRNLNTAFDTLLVDKMPSINWPKMEISLAIVRKYMFIHHCFEAPIDEATSQSMCIELIAYLVRFGHKDLDAKSWQELRVKRWCDNNVEEIEKFNIPLIEQMTFAVGIATYSNISYPGYGIPCYI